MGLHWEEEPPECLTLKTNESRRAGEICGEIELWEIEALFLKGSHINQLTQNFNTETALRKVFGSYEKEIYWLILRYMVEGRDLV